MNAQTGCGWAGDGIVTSTDEQIPGIDLGPYLRGEAGALERTAGQLRHVCENVGFFTICNHGIPQALIDATFAASRRVHALPEAAKREIKLNAHTLGYMFVNESIQKRSTVETARRANYNESFFCGRERSPDDPEAAKPFRGVNQWPGDLPGFKEAALAYQAAVERLGLTMLPVVARALDLPEGFFADYFRTPYMQLRLLHYPPRDASVPDQFGAGAHTDQGFLTFLMQGEVGGLQIRRTDGTWIDAPVMPGRYIVNTGDILRRWTNDRFLSTPHRVMNVSGTDRYSIAFFFGPDLDRELECLPTCEGPGRPRLYPPITYAGYKQSVVSANYSTIRPGA